MGSVADLTERRTNLCTETTVTEFYVSGFGQFFEVKDNPSESLVNELKVQESRIAKESELMVIRSTDVLTASARDIDVYLNDVYSRLQVSSQSNIGRSTRSVLLHLGADMSSDTFLLEYQGRNEASFVRPDEAGWQPCREKINPDNELNHSLMTVLPVDRLKRILREQEHKVGVSTDAGRFVCNWMYYKSLEKSLNMENVLVLFVHVPGFHIISEEEQRKFVLDLIKAIACES